VLQRRWPDTYDFGLCALQAGRLLGAKTRVGLAFEWLGFVRLPRNEGNPDEFAVGRYGLAITQTLPADFSLQAVGGLAHGADATTFFRVGFSYSLTRNQLRTAR
jgi:hypothetical protein